MNKYSEAVNAAIDSNEVFEYELRDKKYLRVDDIVGHALNNAKDIGIEDYEELMSYLNSQRQAHNLGKEFEFNPPAVPFDKKGLYYEVFSIPTKDEVAEVVAGYMANEAQERRYIYRSSAQPNMMLPEKYMLPIYRHFELTATDMGTNSMRYLAVKEIVDEIMRDDGWTFDEFGNAWLMQIPINREAKATMNEMFDGRYYRPVYFYGYIAKDAYGREYSLLPEQYPEDFIEYVEEMAEKYNYVLKDHVYQPKPVEMPDNIEEIGREILETAKVLRTKVGYQVVPLYELARLASENHDLNLTPEIIKGQLLGRDGDWRVPLILHQYRLDYDTIWIDHFPEDVQEEITENRGGKYVHCILKERRLGVVTDRKVQFASGFPVTLMEMVVDNRSNELVLIDMVGPRDSVRANWAQLVQDRHVYWNGNNFKVGSSKNHRMFETTLPSGLYEMALINTSASPQEVDSQAPKIYLLADPDEQVPSGFIGALDNFISTPLSPSWATDLWVLGRAIGLIEWTGDPDKQVGAACYTIRKPESDSWERLISTQVAAKTLTF